MHSSLTQSIPTQQVKLSCTDQKRLDALEARLEDAKGRFVGYPCDLTFDYSKLFRFFKYAINNVGDAFVSSTYELNTKDFERDVLAAFGRWTRIPEKSLWGYVTNGGTEGNTHGLLLAREACPNGVVYYSEVTHYSVPKAARLLNLPAIKVKSQSDGCIDLDDLRQKVQSHRWGTAILVANIGTTMKGAIDDIPGMQQVMKDLGKKQHYIHADAAFSGMILPFVDDPEPWNFAAGVDSISISGHKLIGSPIPCGVLLARKCAMKSGRVIEYVATADTTLSGSRNGSSGTPCVCSAEAASAAACRKVLPWPTT
jgi:histidine decarboxylase